MSTTYTVVSDRLHVIVDGGRKRTFYRGDSISILTKEQADRFKRLGAIASGGNDAAEAAQADAENPSVATGPNPAELSDGDASAPSPTGITVPQASEIVPTLNAGAAPAVQRPAKAATAEAWKKYAVDSGQLTKEEAAEKTRDELRDTLK